MDLLGPLPKMKSINRFIIVANNRFSKLARAILTEKQIAAHLTKIFLEAEVTRYGITDCFLTNNEPQFASVFLNSAYIVLGKQLLAIIANDPRPSGQVNRYDKTIKDRHWYYIGKHQKYLKEQFQLLPCSYKTQVHNWMRKNPPSLMVPTERYQTPHILYHEHWAKEKKMWHTKKWKRPCLQAATCSTRKPPDYRKSLGRGTRRVVTGELYGN